MNRTVKDAIRYRNTTEYVITEPGTTLEKRVTVTDAGTVHPSRVSTSVTPYDLQAINQRNRENHQDAVDFCKMNGIDPADELSDPRMFTVDDVRTREELDKIME